MADTDFARGRKELSRTIRLGATIALGVALLAVVLWRIGPERLTESLSQLSLPWILAGLGFYAISFLFRGLMWKLLLAPIQPHTRLSDLIAICLVGWFANSFLPFRVGEVTRAVLLRQREHVGLSRGLSSIAVERLFDLSTILLLASFGLLLLPAEAIHSPYVVNALRVGLVLALLGFIIIVIAVRYRVRIIAWVERALTTLHAPALLLRATNRLLEGIIRGAEGVTQPPPMVLAIFLLSIAGNSTQIGLFYTFFQAHDLAIPLETALAGTILVSLATVLPVTIANAGTFELLFAAIFTPLTGIAFSDLLSLALIIHGAQLLFIAITGAAALSWLGVGLRQLAPGGQSLSDFPER